MKLRPLYDHVVVRPLETESKTAGGILLPDTAKEKPTRGEVTAVGKGRLLANGRLVEPIVKTGDTVLFGRYSGTEMKIDGVEYRIVNESEILAILSE